MSWFKSTARESVWLQGKWKGMMKNENWTYSRDYEHFLISFSLVWLGRRMKILQLGSWKVKSANHWSLIWYFWWEYLADGFFWGKIDHNWFFHWRRIYLKRYILFYFKLSSQIFFWFSIIKGIILSELCHYKTINYIRTTRPGFLFLNIVYMVILFGLMVFMLNM